ncbi:hypothetical protein BDY21DRAFT_348542 [Lineolata rhizophorae]|uniref:Integral membrane protein n=1 Tax=Lineolata rhizophorae TaxID=578093 RepID=A0A6A6NW07_9PEZI|nr:hypothetical protein BDY21DRAFT_348542 [Lineolata rhizophorae]
MTARALVPFLVAMMLLTGVCNTLLTKYQDMQCVGDCDDPNPNRQKFFRQPVIQTLQMFIGETGCWLVVGGGALWSRYFSRSKAGYQPVATAPSADEASPNGANDTTGITAEESNSSTDTAVASNPPDDQTSTSKPLHAERRPLKGWRVILLALPACCDIAGTTLMNVGLLFVAASIYQMTRGALVLFVGLFSVIFLRHRLGFVRWMSLVIVVVGVAIVGLAGAIAKDDGGHGKEEADSTTAQLLHQEVRRALAVVSRSLDDVEGRDKSRHTSPASGDPALPVAVQTVLGVLMIAGAQIFTATQFVLEESIMHNFALDPLKVVGWEGLFGMLVTAVGMVILHFAVGVTEAGRGGYFDAKEGMSEVFSNRAIGISSLLCMISIGGFNFFGLSVTRSVSATSRSTIDTCRTLFIWIVSLGLGWETFKWLQVLGFAVLVYGTFLFNEVVRPPLAAYFERRRATQQPDEEDELLPEHPIEHN